MKTWKKFACYSLLLLALFDAGCGTVAPREAKARQASIDVVPDPRGNLQNSGALYFTNFASAGMTNRCLVVTDQARARYVDLVQRWGSRFVPSLTATGGVWQVQAVPYPLWAIEKARVVDWSTMNRWQANPSMAPIEQSWWKRRPWWFFPVIVFAVSFVLFIAAKRLE